MGNLGFFKMISRGVRGHHHVVRGYSQHVPLEPMQGNQELFRAEGELGVLFPCSRILGLPLEIQEVRHASSCGARGSWDSSRVEAGNGPSCPHEVGNPGLFLSCGGKLGFHLEL